MEGIEQLLARVRGRYASIRGGVAITLRHCDACLLERLGRVLSEVATEARKGLTLASESFRLIDHLYEAFRTTLPDHLRYEASCLAHTLGLAPSPKIPWSAVFGHPITLTAPLMVAEAMKGIPPRHVRDAVLAHMLAVIEAFGSDRVEDRQITPTARLVELLAEMRDARDEALERVAPGVSDPHLDFSAAWKSARGAAALESAIFANDYAVDIEGYVQLSADKQRFAYPASIALAYAAGWTEDMREALRQMIMAIALGLQIHDDVMDWNDDHARGGAWAVALAHWTHNHVSASERETMRPGVQSLVLQTGVLVQMLASARQQFRIAEQCATALDLPQIAGWCEERAGKMEDLARGEAAYPGYAARSRVLSSWIREVIA